METKRKAVEPVEGSRWKHRHSGSILTVLSKTLQVPKGADPTNIERYTVRDGYIAFRFDTHKDHTIYKLDWFYSDFEPVVEKG